MISLLFFLNAKSPTVKNSFIISNWSWDIILSQEDDELYETFEYQVRYLQQRTMINIQTLCKLLRISIATYYVLFPLHNNSIPQSSPNSPGRPPITSLDDENAFLNYIHESQLKLNSIRPKGARELLQNYILETKQQNIVLDRFWFHRFRERHSDVLKIMKVHSRESE